jgi:hypothetical protein
MAVYQVTFHQRLDDYAVVQTLTEPDIAVGQSITLAGLGHHLNGASTLSTIYPVTCLLVSTLKATCYLIIFSRYKTKCCFTTQATT